MNVLLARFSVHPSDAAFEDEVGIEMLKMDSPSMIRIIHGFRLLRTLETSLQRKTTCKH